MGRAKQQQQHRTTDMTQGPAETAIVGVATAADREAETPPQLAVGAECPVYDDFLDMEVVPTEDGLAHAGYLVLVRGEIVRLLYVGSTQTGDAGWIYAEVLRTLRPEPVGRRGWLPRKSLERPAPVAPPPPTRTAAAAPPKTTRQRSNLQVGIGVRPNTARGGSGHAIPVNNEAFPALVAQPVPQPQPPPPPPDKPKPRLSPQDIAKAIERQRAAAAAAVAKDRLGAARGTGAAECPICAGQYSSMAGRRRMRRPCCGSELCALCDHKSLRSGKCYFCREASEEFPSLVVACRVTS